jgi:hypothetical protein
VGVSEMSELWRYLRSLGQMPHRNRRLPTESPLGYDLRDMDDRKEVEELRKVREDQIRKDAYEEGKTSGVELALKQMDLSVVRKDAIMGFVEFICKDMDTWRFEVYTRSPIVKDDVYDLAEEYLKLKEVTK